jgi:hypothetical protein
VPVGAGVSAEEKASGLRVTGERRTNEIQRRGRRWQVDPRAKWSFYSPFSWANLFYQMWCVTDQEVFFQCAVY